MTIRCPECGYENRDMYRFCGMCGATLRRETSAETAPPPQAVKPAEEPPRQSEAPPPVSTPGFITGAPAAPDLDYLLEDDAPRSHGKLIVALVLLVLAGSLVAWHWRRDGYPWASNSSTSPTSAASAPAPVASTPNSTPAPVPAAKTSSPPLQPAPASEKAASVKPQAVAKETQSQPEAAPAADANAAPDGDAKAGEQPASGDSAEENQPQPAAVKPAPPPPAPKPKPEPRPAAPSAPALAGDDKLVAEGEKYLYGNGVPENCDVAEKNLRTAAGHSNARALTLMGAMYATGHCVNRDLPTAYRWFAKALHQDPSNTRVQQDLEILWKQMTPEERQLATKSGG